MPKSAVAVLVLLAAAAVEAQNIVTAPGSGGGPNVKVFNAAGTTLNSFYAYSASFTGGVSVAYGDVNGDGVPDIITGAGPGGGPEVRVFDGNDTSKVLYDFLAYSPSFTGGVWVASGDVNGDGYDDIITGCGAGSTLNVNVYDGRTGSLLASFLPFSLFHTGGVTVAAADVNGDGKADVIVGMASGGGQVKVYDGTSIAGVLTTIWNFYPYGNTYTGGVFVASADLNGDGKADIITGSASGSSLVNVYDGSNLSSIWSFYPFGNTFTGGARVAMGDVNGDFVPDIITGAGPGGSPEVLAFALPSQTVLAGFFAYSASFSGGIFVGGYTPKPTATITGSTIVCPNNPGTVSATLTGRSPWQVTWNDGFVDSPVNTPYYVRSVYAAGTYAITNVADVNHPHGVASGIANVASSPAPSITTAPQNQTINAGETATLTVVASGATTYQWYTGSGQQIAIINGATSSSYTTPALTSSTSYTVIVSNGTCSVSASARVSVRPPAPTGVEAHAIATNAVAITWDIVSGANEYLVYRRAPGQPAYALLTGVPSPPMTDTTVFGGATFIYYVTTVEGVESLPSAPDPATTILFADDPLVAGLTVVKANHIAQLRQASNAFLQTANNTFASWTNPTLTAGVSLIKAVDITDLRTAINNARIAIGLPALTFTDPVLDSTVPVKAVHIMELRSAVR